MRTWIVLDFIIWAIIIRPRSVSYTHLLGRLKKHILGWLANTDIDTVNGRRTEILKNCLDMGNSDRGLFSLTVPTLSLIHI